MLDCSLCLDPLLEGQEQNDTHECHKKCWDEFKRRLWGGMCKFCGENYTLSGMDVCKECHDGDDYSYRGYDHG